MSVPPPPPPPPPKTGSPPPLPVRNAPPPPPPPVRANPPPPPQNVNSLPITSSTQPPIPSSPTPPPLPVRGATSPTIPTSTPPPPISKPPVSSAIDEEFEGNEDVINPVKTERAFREGVMSKRNREGKFEKIWVAITTENFYYFKMPKKDTIRGAQFQPPDLSAMKAISFETLTLDELKVDDWAGFEKRVRALRLLSKVKSFLIRAPSEELKYEWKDAILSMATSFRQSKSFPEPIISELCPIWQLSDSGSCSLCSRRFNFFVRKHHCRNCGVCVCELCSMDRVRLLHLDPRKLFRVCSDCGRHIKETRVYAPRAQFSEQD